MAFKGITFAGQNVTPKNDGALYASHYGDGILDGCSMTISGDDLVIQSGHFIAGGRVCQVDGATNVDLSTRTLTNGYIQVVVDFDISKPEGQQWNPHTPLIESATTSFPALTKENLNGTGTLYQIALAVVQISGGNLTAINSSLSRSSVVAYNENGEGVRVFILDDGTFRIGSFDPSAGSSLLGLASNDSGNLLVYAEDEDVIVRPAGISADTTQIRFTPEGWAIYPEIVQQISGAISGSTRATATARRRGNTVNIVCTGGAGSAFSNFTSGVQIGTLPAGFRPSTSMVFAGFARTSGAWASATYYPIILGVGTNGAVDLRGNQTNIRTCTYLEVDACYAV